MAHTAARQTRCNAHFSQNGAVYLETMFRNVATSELIQSQFATTLNQTIFQGVATFPNGGLWLQALLTHTWIPIDNEVAAWTAAGIRRWKIQVYNLKELGLSSSITIVNAMGVSQVVTIMSIPSIQRSAAVWTTAFMYYGFWNDLWLCPPSSGLGCSLVRNVSNSIDAMGINWDFSMTGNTDTNSSHTLRTHVGPFQSIDIYMVLPPASLIALSTSFHEQLINRLRNNLTSLTAYNKLPETLVDPIPLSWTGPNMLYYGGSPLCPFGKAEPYVQQPMNFYDTCQYQTPYSMQLRKESTLFAMAVTQITGSNVTSLCSLCKTQSNVCRQTLQQGLTVSTTYRFGVNITKVTRDIISLGAGFIQMALQNYTNNILLSQPLISNPPDVWSFYGWLMLYEWVDGDREVYTFAGDYQNVTLMSSMLDPLPLIANPLELPHHACTYVWFVVVYITVVLVWVGFLQVVFAVFWRYHSVWQNLLQWNRVAGSVWIGRPFMVLRGLVAVVILSTAPVVFQVDNGFTHFQFQPRSVFHRCVLVGETLWFSYAVIDFLLPFTQRYSRLIGPMSSVLSFLAIFIIDSNAPVQVQATIGNDCSIVAFNRGLDCTSGTVHIGSLHRIGLFVALQLGAVLLSYTIFRISFKLHASESKNQHVLIPAAAEMFLVPSEETFCHLDNMSCVLSGILVFNQVSFDLKTWSLLRSTVESTAGPKLPEAETINAPTSDAAASPRAQGQLKVVFRLIKRIRRWRDKHMRVMGALSLGYMAMSVSSSYAFLVLTKSTMANDFYWVLFDSDAQSYLTNWFNLNLQLTASTPQIKMDQTVYSAAVSTNNAPNSVTYSSNLYPNAIQDEANTLPNVIQAMRAMDGCQVPWIMTAYCYVDFGRRWSMAHSTGKGQRCTLEHCNGAVYLEATLRNIQWARITTCYGLPLDIGVFSFLRTFDQGQEWLDSIQRTTNSLSAEVNCWSQYGITRYTTQWQNYKTLGVIESFTVENAFGLTYPLTLKRSTGVYQFSAQTSFKMYWSFAGDLAAIAANGTSPIAGQSLVASAPNFAFSNISFEAVLKQNGTLVAPLGIGTTLVRNLLGPYGTITLKRVAVPYDLRQLHQNYTSEVMQLISSSYQTQEAFWSSYEDFTFTPRPQRWDASSLHNGNLFCDIDVADDNHSPLVGFSFMGVCSNNFYEESYGTTLELTNAVLAANLIAPGALQVTDVCNRETLDKGSCIRQVNETTFFLASNLANLHLARAEGVKTYIRDTLLLEFVQYISTNNDVTFQLSQVNIFDPSETQLELFSWVMVFDWVRGKREVLTLQGDTSTVTILSTYVELVSVPVNVMEVPLNVALYMRYVLQYVTGICFTVACLICGYIAWVHGRVEASNMMSFNRVAGMVWIGRPLLLVRAVTGIIMLSTSGLVLTRPFAGFMASFVSETPPWYTTILSAGELSWFVYIINDTFSVFTRQYTYTYSMKSSLLVWFTTAMWGLVSPVKHTGTIARVCTVVTLDFQIQCISGVLAIGSYSRFCGLVGLVFGCCFVCYVYERIKNPHLTANASAASFFLYASAKHQFFKSKWDFAGVHFLDQASAALNGVLTMELQSTWYVLDVKTWRLFVYKLDCGVNQSDLPPHLQHAMPLLE
ncbi:Aste57867_15639 [Aphanomyces stellatus]|uniref:Aste57867_15639 protein n=1 Tax=Aphanomyces stellatus TaxID=120398 RepID=A0A485L461_9STRA|nr:hypothetical protein As57867_015583 [Aphanomyces stellatus]VFT92436.1 Aste57867_15639 [Aphanomyces stellatus]